MKKNNWIKDLVKDDLINLIKNVEQQAIERTNKEWRDKLELRRREEISKSNILTGNVLSDLLKDTEE